MSDATTKPLTVREFLAARIKVLADRSTSLQRELLAVEAAKAELESFRETLPTPADTTPPSTTAPAVCS